MDQFIPATPFSASCIPITVGMYVLSLQSNCRTFWLASTRRQLEQSLLQNSQDGVYVSRTEPHGISHPHLVRPVSHYFPNIDGAASGASSVDYCRLLIPSSFPSYYQSALADPTRYTHVVRVNDFFCEDWLQALIGQEALAAT